MSESPITLQGQVVEKSKRSPYGGLLAGYMRKHNIHVYPLVGSPTHGSVQVKMLSASGETISDTVTFLYTKGKKHYTEERRKKIRSHLDGEINSSEDGLEYLSLLLEKMKEMDLNSKGGSSANGEQRRMLHLILFNCTNFKMIKCR